jgi:hypothetical protein
MIDINQIKKNQLKIDKKNLEDIGQFTLIRFHVGDKNYAVDIKNVHEILESLDYTPYPEKLNNHIGILNVRGEIIPLIQFDKNFSFNKKDKFKIIILEFETGKLNAIKTDKVHKCTQKSKFLIAGQTINLNGIPSFYIDESNFENLFKETA